VSLRDSLISKKQAFNVLTRPKSTDLDRIQGVFSSRRRSFLNF